MSKEIKRLLDIRFIKHNHIGFIPNDPISIPHRFEKKEDIEIIGFLIALIAWGQRISIINSGNRLIEIMQGHPHDFIINHQPKDLKKCLSFVHRTFNGEDLWSLIGFLQWIYNSQGGLEFTFSKFIDKNDLTIENGLIGFRKLYEESEFALQRTLKHIASPLKGSACKRLNMYLRWMVRQDDSGIDFGIWKSIKTSQLVCPLDVHVLNQAAALGLIKQGKGDWKTALELTKKLRRYDPIDPVKYDIALFGEGANKDVNS
ncbi:MAG: TIGR02757 family protein [Bacteroidia bacterium]|nr:TIGR02757 family protein [Bacteroidia bacterium]